MKSLFFSLLIFLLSTFSVNAELSFSETEDIGETAKAIILYEQCSCTEDCIEYLTPKKYSISIYRDDCEKCQQCVFRNIYYFFGRDRDALLGRY